jgi:hypothetical protein
LQYLTNTTIKQTATYTMTNEHAEMPRLKDILEEGKLNPCPGILYGSFSAF